ncbi:2,5-didehydrogluconate reductase DkgB [Alteromonas sp. ASW11-130]|uniref:2,5-didehydrogluconate reductase DkgB n=1 Tax=Alteromonas sp. ASW11-130 TaxID=3015775 RepID=UPI0022419DED|nr:2,5-didehydrogluconate reductase DkgB [Alteromonas sp. ASW11-130]MCW8091416.1 2,5-didehydrogluconate reductase DkgB [Alteromonas sp. ASW11-130]
MPQIGAGTFRLEGKVARQSVLDALEIGYRHIDTAQIYGNEEQVGDAIQTSGVDRESIFLTTKVWYEKLGKSDFIPSVHESLSKLKTDYVDLLLVHWPYPSDKIPMEEYLNCLAQAKEQGLCRHIGVSNFTLTQMDRAVSILGENAIYTNQVECHPFMQNRQVAKACYQHNMKLTAYMPLAVGKVMKDKTLNQIAEKYNATPAQIALAWAEKNNMFTIPSSTNRKHLQSNFDSQDIKLDEEDITRIDDLEKGERIVDPDFAPNWD